MAGKTVAKVAKEVAKTAWKESTVRIIVIGVGGVGNSAISRMAARVSSREIAAMIKGADLAFGMR